MHGPMRLPTASRSRHWFNPPLFVQLADAGAGGERGGGEAGANWDVRPIGEDRETADHEVRHAVPSQFRPGDEVADRGMPPLRDDGRQVGSHVCRHQFVNVGGFDLDAG